MLLLICCLWDLSFFLEPSSFFGTELRLQYLLAFCTPLHLFLSKLVWMFFLYLHFFLCFCLLFLIQQHSYGSTNSTFRKIDLLYSAFSFCIAIQFSIEWFTAFYLMPQEKNLKAGYLESANLKTLFKDSTTNQTIHKIWFAHLIKSFFLLWSQLIQHRKEKWKGLFACLIGSQTFKHVFRGVILKPSC